MSEQVGAARSRSRRRRENVPGGRPHEHRVKLSDEEEARALVMAQEAGGVTIARVLVERAFAPEGGATSTERRDFLAELFRVRRLLAANSNNLNQITRAVNSGAPLDSQIVHTLRAIDDLTATIDTMLRDAAVR